MIKTEVVRIAAAGSEIIDTVTRTWVIFPIAADFFKAISLWIASRRVKSIVPSDPLLAGGWTALPGLFENAAAAGDDGNPDPEVYQTVMK